MMALSALIENGLDQAIVDGCISKKFELAINYCQRDTKDEFFRLELDKIDSESSAEIICAAIRQNRSNPNRQHLIMGLAFNDDAKEKWMCQLFDALLADTKEKVEVILSGNMDLDACPQLFEKCLENLSRYRFLELSAYSFNELHLQQLIQSLEKLTNPEGLSLEILADEISNENYQPLKNYCEKHKLELIINDFQFDYRPNLSEKSTYHAVDSSLNLKDNAFYNCIKKSTIFALPPLVHKATEKADKTTLYNKHDSIKDAAAVIKTTAISLLSSSQKLELEGNNRGFNEKPIEFLKNFLTDHPLDYYGKRMLEEKVDQEVKKLKKRRNELEKTNTSLVMSNNLNEAVKTMENNNIEIQEIKDFVYDCFSLRSMIQTSLPTQKKRPTERPEKDDSKRQKLSQQEHEEDGELLKQALALSLQISK